MICEQSETQDIVETLANDEALTNQEESMEIKVDNKSIIKVASLNTLDTAVEIESISSDESSGLFSYLNGNKHNDLENSRDPSFKQGGHVLTWSNVNMKLKSKNKSRDLLKNVSGAVLPGQLTAIMGHSGAGKSTLLNILAGKIQSSGNVSVKYDIQLDGKKVTPSAVNLRRKIAFVAQKDILFHTSTTREAIRFSARLRLDRDVSDETVEQLTDNILSELKLDRVADSKIAQLSGGEMRRTSLGIELVARPSIVLLDEVTSGLDSYNAMQVLDVLKKISVQGASVLFTLHQPNSQMFAAIDHLILLHEGRCMYQGAVDEIPTYFAERGCPVPEKYNPADWVIAVSEGTSSTKELDKLRFFSNFPGEESRQNTCNTMLQTAKSRDSEEISTPKNVSMFKEVELLVKRGWNNVVRDSKLLMLRFGMIVVCAGIISIVFAKVGEGSLESMIDFQSHLGCTFFLCIAGSIVSQVVLLEFIDERPVVLRELSTNHYGLASYTISRLAIEGVSVFIQVLIFNLVIYWSLGLQGRFWYLLLCFYAYAMAATSGAVAMGAQTKDPRNAKEFLPMIMLPQLLFCGFFVSLADIPVWLRWLQWIMPLTYTFRLVATEEFSFCKQSLTLAPGFICHNYLEEQDATSEFTSFYWEALIGIMVFCRFVTLYFMKRKMKLNASSN